MSLCVHGNVVVLWLFSVQNLSGEITSNAEVLVSICITSARNTWVENKSFNDVFFPAKSGPTHHGQEVFKSEIQSSSAAHFVNGSES